MELSGPLQAPAAFPPPPPPRKYIRYGLHRRLVGPQRQSEPSGVGLFPITGLDHLGDLGVDGRIILK